MSTPAIRATCLRFSLLALTLLVLGVFADHAHGAMPLDDLAAIAHLLDRGPDLHGVVIVPTRVSGESGLCRGRWPRAPPEPCPPGGSGPPGGEPSLPEGRGPCGRSPVPPFRARWGGVR